MSITLPVPEAPSRANPSNFSTLADALLSWLCTTFVTELNATAAAMNLNDTTASSTTSMTIGTGSQSFTADTDKSFQVGMSVMIAHDSANWMHGQVTSYTSGTGAMVVNVTNVMGSGTETSWTISLSGPIALSLGTFITSLLETTTAAAARAILSAAASTDLAGRVVGFAMSNATDTDHDITIGPGLCRDSTNAATIVLPSAMTKQIDATWAAGNNAGGLDTGTVAASSDYYVYAIYPDDPDDDDEDLLISLSKTAPTMPSGYTLFRRVRSLRTDSSANILNGAWNGREFSLNTKVNVRTLAAIPNTSRNLATMPVPPNMTAIAICQRVGISGTSYMNIGPTTDADYAPTSMTCMYVVANGATDADEKRIKVDSSSQIYYRGSSTDGELAIVLLGWIDDQDENDFTAGAASSSAPSPQIWFSSSPDDDTWQGPVTSGIAGEAFSQWDNLYPKNVSGTMQWFKYDANGADKLKAPCAIAIKAAAGAGSSFSYGFGTGIARNDGWSMTTNQDEGKLVYADPATAGGITLTEPSTSGDEIAVLGRVLEQNVIQFNLGNVTLIEVA
jgi:hypothetical protein